VKTKDEAKEIHRSRKLSVAGLWFYSIATLVTLALFCACPSWGTGVFLGITVITFLGHVLNVVRLRRKSVQSSSACKTKEDRGVTSNSSSAIYDSENGLWSFAFGEAGSLLVAGSRTEPSSVLVVSASWFRQNAQQFQEEVSDFLLLESKKFGKWPDAVREIKALRIESIQLPWTERPTDGMLYFTGNESDRVWRCDVVDRHPMNLGFDD
jgi:hypothetical protein